MIRNRFTSRKVMVQSVYILNILTGQYIYFRLVAYHVEWMTCEFSSIFTVFQLYQDNVRVIIKGCVQWKPVYGWTDFHLQ